MGIRLITPPADEPISLIDGKVHCRVDGTDDDVLITSLIAAARRMAEQTTGRALVTQQWEVTLDAFPSGIIALPLPPLVSVQSIKYVDAAGALQTLASGAYTVHTSGIVGRVAAAYDTTWPDTRAQPDAVTIAFTAGYGVATSVPQEIRQWMLLQIAHWYAVRESVNVGNIVNELPFVGALLDPYRIAAV